MQIPEGDCHFSPSLSAVTSMVDGMGDRPVHVLCPKTVFLTGDKSNRTQRFLLKSGLPIPNQSVWRGSASLPNTSGWLGVEGASGIKAALYEDHPVDKTGKAL